MCYEKFGWKPEDIPNIPDLEALRIAIVFEEEAKYHYKKNKELDHHANDYETVEELPGE